MKSIFIVTTLMILAGTPSALLAQSSALGSSASPAAAQWSVQLEKVDPADVKIEPAFTIAIYENMLDELAKIKVFKQVFRTGDHNASDVHDLLILKITVQKYTPGSETKRAVTTIAGATKLNVKSQLSTRDGKVVLEKVVDGNVRFIGGNLRATHNLARNVAKTIKQSTLQLPTP